MCRQLDATRLLWHLPLESLRAHLRLAHRPGVSRQKAPADEEVGGTKQAVAPALHTPLPGLIGRQTWREPPAP